MTFTAGARIALYRRLWRLFRESPGYYIYLLRRPQAARMRESLRRGRPPAAGGFFPSRLNLRLLYACNLRCRMCGQWGETGTYHGHGPERRQAMLPVETIDRVLAELVPKGLRLVDMEGGETLLYPRFEELLALLRRWRLHVKFATNGTLLDRHAEAIVAARVRSVTVSLDGDRAVHDRIRGLPGAYDQTLEGLRALAAAKRRLRRAGPLVQVAFTTSRHNGAAALAALCADLRGRGVADVVEVKLTPVFIPPAAADAYRQLLREWFGVEEGIVSPDGFREDYRDFAEEGRRLAATVAELVRQPLDFRLEPLPHLPPAAVPRLYTDYFWDLGRRPCPVPYDEPTIDADGNVYPCNLFTDPPMAMGNVHHTPFLEIWHGPRFERFRRLLAAQGGLLPICYRCCQLTEA